MRVLIRLMFLCVFSISLNGQISLTGKILDNENLPIEFVNVILLESEEKTYYKGGVTDESGVFTFEGLASNNYTIEISFIGYTSITQEVSISETMTLPPFVLQTDENRLDEIAITAKKPVFERKSDRTIVNVQNAITSAGNDALQILERSPGVQVDRANNGISLMGKNGVVVAINGKRTRLNQEALIQLLASTPSSNIQRIELITNPPASFDAQGDGGVINIVMIKNENDGFNGNTNILLGMSRKPKYGGGVNFNLNRGMINLYGDFSTNLQFDKGIEYGFFISGSKRVWDLDATSTTDYFAPIENVTKEILRSNESNQTDHYMVSNHIGIQLNEANKITIDYDYLNYEIYNPTTYEIQQSGLLDSEISESQFSSDKETPFDFHVFKTDFESEMSDNMKYQFGAKATLSNVANRTNLTYFNPNPIIDPFFTDLIQMEERIIAGYASLNGSIGEANTFTAGMRYEDYSVNLISDKDGNLIDRSRGRFYPTLSLNHKFIESHSISFYYNERVNRPGFQVLAPSFYFFDTHTVLGGNVQALPTITRTVGSDLNLGTLFVSFSYSDEDEPISWGQPGLNGDSNILILKPQNAPDRDIFTLTLSFPYSFTSFWSSQWNTNLFYRKETAFLEGELINNKGLAAFGNITQNFKLPNKWEAEVTTTWNSNFQVGLANFKPRFSANIGLQKTFSNASKISLSWNDIFNWGSFFGLLTDRESEGIYYDWNYELEGNVVRLTYSMPFGNTGLKVRDKHTSGSEDEQRRAQN